MEINAVSKGKEIADEDLKRFANAAERIASRWRKRKDEAKETVAWLKVKKE
jgi:hypothetical protein